MRRRHHLQRFFPRPGSPQGRGALSPAALAVVVALALGLGFGLGQWLRMGSSAAEAALAQAEADFSRRLQAQQEQAAVKAREYAIIEDASARLQVDNQELLASMAALEGRVAFFKRMAAPQAARSPVEIELFELLPASTPDKVRYRLLITRSNPTGAVAQGTVRVRISGGGKQQELTLDAPRFQLRYYQQFSGEWKVPAGFAPERVDVQVRSNGVAVERRYKWEIKSR